MILLETRHDAKFPSLSTFKITKAVSITKPGWKMNSNGSMSISPGIPGILVPGRLWYKRVLAWKALSCAKGIVHQRRDGRAACLHSVRLGRQLCHYSSSAHPTEWEAKPATLHFMWATFKCSTTWKFGSEMMSLMNIWSL